MKYWRRIYHDERGVTLIELVMVIFVSGILSVAIVNLYRMAITNWQTASSRGNIYRNSVNFLQSISSDVREASQITQSQDERLMLIQDKEQVRYQIRENGNMIQIIREIHEYGAPGWEQLPRFPVAEFSKNELKLSLLKVSPYQVQVNIESFILKLQTTISRRI